MINLPQEVCDVGYHRNIVSGGTASREICFYSHSTWIWVFVGSGTISLPPVVPYSYFRHSNCGLCFHLLSWSNFLRKSGLILWSDSSPNGDWSTNRLDFDHTSWGCRSVPKITNSVPSHFRFTNCLCNFQTFSESGLSCGLQSTVVSSRISLDSCRIQTQKYTCFEKKIHVIEAIFWFILTLLGNFQTNRFQRRRLTECGMCTIRRLVANVAELSKPGEWLKGKCSLYHCLMRN